MIEQMMDAVVLATIFGGIALIVGVFFWGIKVNRRLSDKRTPQQLQEETRIIQEIYRGLNEMEERIGTLETILFDKQRSDRRKMEVDHE